MAFAVEIGFRCGGNGAPAYERSVLGAHGVGHHGTPRRHESGGDRALGCQVPGWVWYEASVQWIRKFCMRCGCALWKDDFSFVSFFVNEILDHICWIRSCSSCSNRKKTNGIGRLVTLDWRGGQKLHLQWIWERLSRLLLVKRANSSIISFLNYRDRASCSL